MPIAASSPEPAFVFYYNLIGNANNPAHDQYRSNNPWQIATKFCDELVQKVPGVVSVATHDDSVYFVRVVQESVIEAVATAVLNLFDIVIAPSHPDDIVVAVIPKNGMMVELVHTPVNQTTGLG